MGHRRRGSSGRRHDHERNPLDRVTPARRWLALAAVAIITPTLLAGCSSDEGGTPALTWYINPDNGGQSRLATRCTEASGGAYRISIQVLPNDADAQREQLVRRLAADDPSIDLMSLDPPFVAEFANAGYLLPITNEADVKTFTDGVLAAPLETAFWNNQLVAPPFWANTQLLWYRKSVASAAGVDPTAANFTWSEMIKAAEAQGKRIGVQGRRYEGYMVWINALISSAGGEILTNPELGVKATPSMASPAGDEAADIVGTLARSSAAPADMSTAGEEEARSTFQSSQGSFMVNWPYVYGAAKDSVKAGAISQSVFDDIAWARYPEATEGKVSTPPLGGINLAIGKFTKHPDQALAAAKCITSLESDIAYMIDSGNPAARGAAYDDPGVRQAFPMADLIRQSINEAGPRPVTPYYGDVSVSVQRTWHPSADVHQPNTPKETDSYMSEVLSGDRLI
jgi:trehalose/maltose transport system substrate-binding protein